MSSAPASARLESTQPSRPAPGTIVIGAALGYIVSTCMQVATRLEIPDLIAGGTTRVADLASRTHLAEHALYRILRVLEMAGIVAESSGRSFELTEAGTLLRTEVPGSMLHMVQFMTDPLHYGVYGTFTDSMRAGRYLLKVFTEHQYLSGLRVRKIARKLRSFTKQWSASATCAFRRFSNRMTSASSIPWSMSVEDWAESSARF